MPATGIMGIFVCGSGGCSCSGQGSYEALAEENGELRFGHAPLTHRHGPLFFRPVLLPPVLNNLDAWIAAQPDPKPSRPEAIRQLIELGLKADKGQDTPPRSRSSRGNEVDQIYAHSSASRQRSQRLPRALPARAKGKGAAWQRITPWLRTAEPSGRMA